MEFLELEDLAKAYTGAWCSTDPERVAAYFSRDGWLQVNDGAPAVGRDAIADTARGFMTAFPDLMVELDDISLSENGAIYRWTLNGTHVSGHRVRVSGYEEWTLGEDGLIAESLGHFDGADYERQLAGVG